MSTFVNPAEFPRLQEAPVIALDCETTGLRWWKDRIFSFAVAVPGAAYYFDLRDKPQALKWLLYDVVGHVPVIAAHHAKFDWHFFREAGVPIDPARASCTMTRAALIDEHLFEYNLDYLGRKYVGEGKDKDIWVELAEIFGGPATREAQSSNLPRADPELVAQYAMQDAITCLKLWQWQEQEIERQELQKVWRLEHALFEVLLDIEQHGVRVDVEEAQRAVVRMEDILRSKQREMDAAAGRPFNTNSSKQVRELFNPKKEGDIWKAADGTALNETDGGNPSFGSDALRSMKDPRASLILDIRKLIKTKDTFLRGHILGHHHNGVIHAHFNATKTDGDVGTGTGRLSVVDPALQQIHKRDKEIAAIVRSLFLPDEGCEWVCQDWAQMDFRVFAHYTKSPEILGIYEKDPHADFHKLVADLTGLPRSPRFAGDPNAKQINLGLVFGMGPGRLAAEMGLPHTVTRSNGVLRYTPGPEAKEVFASYHRSVPAVKGLLDDVAAAAKKRGHVTTIMGRRIRFPGGKLTHKAGGLIFQGSAADAMKVKMIELHRHFKATGRGRFMLPVHDEFDWSNPIDEQAQQRRSRVQTLLEAFDGVHTPIKFRVPIRSDTGFGPNWHEASK